MKITNRNCIFLFEVTVILAKMIPLLLVRYAITFKQVIKPRRMRVAGHVTCMGVKGSA
jgi:hypothetical protein